MGGRRVGCWLGAPTTSAAILPAPRGTWLRGRVVGLVAEVAVYIEASGGWLTLCPGKRSEALWVGGDLAARSAQHGEQVRLKRTARGDRGLQHASHDVEREATALEAPADELQANRVADDGAQLRVVALDEQYAVAVVGVCTELQRLCQQAVKAAAEVDAVAREKHSTELDAEHG